MLHDSVSRPDADAGSRWSVWIATGLGVGLATPAPGTVGGLWGLLLVAAISPIQPLGAQLAAIAVTVLVGVAISSRAAAALGAGHDPQAIVLDETVALPIVFLGAGPLGAARVVAGYLLFRCFDIAKPPPADWAEKLPGGWGIIADDCIAAIYAAVALQGLLWLDAVAGSGWLDA